MDVNYFSWPFYLVFSANLVASLYIPFTPHSLENDGNTFFYFLSIYIYSKHDWFN